MGELERCAGLRRHRDHPAAAGLAALWRYERPRVAGLYLADATTSAEEAVQATWRQHFSDDFTASWQNALATGVVPDSASPSLDVPLLPTSGIEPVPMPTRKLTVLFRADPSLWDGRYANNPWLQELPRPLTKVVWDNPLLIAPQLAQSLQLTNGDLARLSVGGQSVVAPVWLLPGQAPDCVTAFVGSGRRAAGSVGTGHGVDFYPLTVSSGPVSLRKVAGRTELASTEHHNLLLETPEEILRHGTLAQFNAESAFRGRRAGRTAPIPARAARAGRVGHEHRSECLYRLQRLHHRLPGRKQHSVRRQRPGARAARNALASGRPVLLRNGRCSAELLSSQ